MGLWMSVNPIEPTKATNRRSFIGRLFTWVGLSALGMSLASTVYANFRFFFPKVLYEPPGSSRPVFRPTIDRRR